jgi:regulator of extracellular matrix RemA (YlzA/DUF370 family)
MNNLLINIGFGNAVIASRIIAVLSPGSAPMNDLRKRPGTTENYWTQPMEGEPGP